MNKVLKHILMTPVYIVLAPFMLPIIGAVALKGSGGGYDVMTPSMEKAAREMDENGTTMLDRYYMQQGARIYVQGRGYMSYDKDGKFQLQPE